MKSPNNIIPLNGKLEKFRCSSSLDLNRIYVKPPLTNKIIFYDSFTSLKNTISGKNIIHKNVYSKSNGLYFNSDKQSYMAFRNPKIQQPYSICVSFKALNGSKQFISQNDNYPTNSPGSYVPIIYFKQNGSIVCEIWNISSSVYDKINVFDNKTHNIVLQVGNNYYKYTVDKDIQNSVIVNGNINLGWSQYYVLGAGYGRDWGNSWNYFNGYIDKFAIYNNTFTEQQLEQILNWI